MDRSSFSLPSMTGAQAEQLQQHQQQQQQHQEEMDSLWAAAASQQQQQQQQPEYYATASLDPMSTSSSLSNLHTHMPLTSQLMSSAGGGLPSLPSLYPMPSTPMPNFGELPLHAGGMRMGTVSPHTRAHTCLASSHGMVAVQADP
jgi:hypothetical protein